MAQNVEIKARLKDIDKTESIARRLSAGDGEVIKQEDIFFTCAAGRLKLRIFSPESGQLIFYRRPNSSGPKISEYYITETREPQALLQVLEKAHGLAGTVRKIRHLYLVGRTRIHIDRVENLGEFLELEVVLSDSEEISAGEQEAQRLMTELAVAKEDLIECAYIDLLQNR